MWLCMANSHCMVYCVRMGHHVGGLAIRALEFVTAGLDRHHNSYEPIVFSRISQEANGMLCSYC